MYTMRFRLRPLVVLSGILFALGSFPSLVEYYQQNLAALSVLLVAAAAACITGNRLALGGGLLAFATMKPDTCGLLVICFLAWASFSWRSRQRLLWSFAGTIAILLAISEIILPNWILRFIGATREYTTYATSPNILQLLFPSFLGTLFSLLLLAFLFGLWFQLANRGCHHTSLSVDTLVDLHCHSCHNPKTRRLQSIVIDSAFPDAAEPVP